MSARPGPMDRLLARLSEDENGCWVHERPSGNGYGYVAHNSRKFLAHRFMYEALIVEIPEGLQLDHLCRTRACCNPWHTEPVTPKVNSSRGLRGPGYRVPICVHGHEKTPENTYVSPKGLRVCRPCKRARWHRDAQARRAT